MSLKLRTVYTGAGAVRDDSTYTAAVLHGDLQHVLSRLTDVLQVNRSLRPRMTFQPVHSGSGSADLQLVVVDADRHRRRPVGLHLDILVVERLKLNVQLRPTNTHTVHADV